MTRSTTAIKLLALLAACVATASCFVVTRPAEPQAPAPAPATAAPAVPGATAAPAATVAPGGPRVMRVPRPGAAQPVATTTAAPPATTTAAPPATATAQPVPSASSLPGVTQQQCVPPLVWNGTSCTYALPPGGRPPGM